MKYHYNFQQNKKKQWGYIIWITIIVSLGCRIFRQIWRKKTDFPFSRIFRGKWCNKKGDREYQIIPFFFYRGKGNNRGFGEKWLSPFSVVTEDDDGEFFGFYWNKEENYYDLLINQMEESFQFHLFSTQRIASPEKFTTKLLKKDITLKIGKGNENIVFSFGDIVVYKQSSKHLSYCFDNQKLLEL